MLKSFEHHNGIVYRYSLFTEDNLNSIIELNLCENDDGTYTMALLKSPKVNLKTLTLGKIGDYDAIK
jgi:hypothetical protein